MPSNQWLKLHEGVNKKTKSRALYDVLLLGFDVLAFRVIIVCNTLTPRSQGHLNMQSLVMSLGKHFNRVEQMKCVCSYGT